MSFAYLECAVKARAAWCSSPKCLARDWVCENYASESGRLAVIERCKQGWTGAVPDMPLLLADVPRLADAFTAGARGARVIEQQILREGRFPSAIQITREADGTFHVANGDPYAGTFAHFASVDTYRAAKAVFTDYILDWNQCEAEYVEDGLAFQAQEEEAS